MEASSSWPSSQSSDMSQVDLKAFEDNNPEIGELLCNNGLALVTRSYIENIQASLAASEMELGECEKQKQSVSTENGKLLQELKVRSHKLCVLEGNMVETQEIIQLITEANLQENQNLKTQVSTLSAEKDQLINLKGLAESFVIKLNTLFNLKRDETYNLVSSPHLEKILENVATLVKRSSTQVLVSHCTPRFTAPWISPENSNRTPKQPSSSKRTPAKTKERRKERKRRARNTDLTSAKEKQIQFTALNFVGESPTQVINSILDGHPEPSFQANATGSRSGSNDYHYTKPDIQRLLSNEISANFVVFNKSL